MASVEDQAGEHTDRLVFQQDSKSIRPDYTAIWKGEWPPPQTLCVAAGATTGRASVFDPSSADTELMLQAEQHPDISIRRYVLISASKILNPAPPGVGWFRGALYVLDES